MKTAKFILAGVLVVLLGTMARGQAVESLSASSVDVLKTARVFPNPAVEYISLKFEQPLARQVTLQVHSIIGNLLEVESEIVDDYEVRVKVKELPAGYYLLDVKLGGTAHNAFKFLKR
jgi:hypothetical protein